MRNLLDNKKGAEMTIGTIIIIILALVLLVFLVFGFSTGWGNLWDKIKNLGAGGSNVDTVKQACAIACSTNSDYDFNSALRTVRFDNAQVKTSCKRLQKDIEVGCYKVDKDLSAPSVTSTKKSDCKSPDQYVENRQTGFVDACPNFS